MLRMIKKIYWFMILNYNNLIRKKNYKNSRTYLIPNYIIWKDKCIRTKNILRKLWFYRRFKYFKRSVKKYNKSLKKIKQRIDRYFKKIQLEIFFGVPGSGKTTFATWHARKAQRLGIKVYSNVPIRGCYKINPREDLGKYLIERCLLIIDEAGLEHNNREYSKFTKENRIFYKMHRHYQCKVIVFSQADDMDLTIRNVAYKLHLVKKSIIPFFITIKPMVKKIDIDKIDHQPKSMYNWDLFIFTQRVFSPVLWKYFDTYQADRLQDKTFEKWSELS